MSIHHGDGFLFVYKTDIGKSMYSMQPGRKITVARQGCELGTFDEEDVKSGLIRGALLPEDNCWAHGMERWLTLRELFPQLCPPLAPLAGSSTVQYGASAADPSSHASRDRGNKSEGCFKGCVASCAAVACVAVLALLIVNFFGNSGSTVGPVANSKHGIFLNGRQFVLRALKSPSTAQFPGIVSDNADISCDYFSDGRIFVEGVSTWVDAQNSFGAIIRTRWQVWYMRDGSVSEGRLKPVWIQIGDDNALGSADEVGRLRVLAQGPDGLRAEF